MGNLTNDVEKLVQALRYIGNIMHDSIGAHLGEDYAKQYKKAMSLTPSILERLRLLDQEPKTVVNLILDAYQDVPLKRTPCEECKGTGRDETAVVYPPALCQPPCIECDGNGAITWAVDGNTRFKAALNAYRQHLGLETTGNGGG